MDLSEIRRALAAGLQPLRVEEPLRLSEWADRHFYLSAESSYVEQRWEAYPPQVGIMDVISDDRVREVTVRKSARVGYTKILLAAIGYFAHHKRRNQGLWQPTDDDADEFCKTELEPMLRDVKAMADVFPEFLAKHKHNTLRQKVFLGSTLYLRGGKAAKNYRRLTLDVAYLDELSGFDRNIEKEGAPDALAAKRVEGATFPKLVAGSTPKIKGLCLIDQRAEQADVLLKWMVPCPHCEEYHPLTWGGPKEHHGMKWLDGDPSTVRHVCPHCGGLMTQADYLSVWRRGQWRSVDGHWRLGGDGRWYDAAGVEVYPPERVAMDLWTACLPIASWQQIVTEFLAAVEKSKAGDKTALQTFVNTTLGEAWEDDEGERADEHELAKRAEAYPLRRVPSGCLVLVAGIDVQDNRFEVVVWGFGRGEEMWVIDYQILAANPADERDWQKLDAYLMTRFPQERGPGLGIEAAAIDTGGHFTHQVYNYVRMRERRRIAAVKGSNRYGLDIKGRATKQDVNFAGKIIPRGVKVWEVGTDTAKDLFFGRLKVAEPGPGYVHFSRDLPDEFYRQLTAEQRLKQKTARGEQYVWVKRRARNEVLDCTVYALFAAQLLDLHRYTAAMWDRLEAAVQPEPDLFTEAPRAEQPAPAPAAPAVAGPTVPPATQIQSRLRAPAVAGGFAREW